MKETLYYAVLIPEKHICHEESVFTNLKDAINYAKQHSNARWKCFKNYEKAKEFACHNETFEIKSPVIGTRDEVNWFRSLKVQELATFRKLIESGNRDQFIECIWSNPHYLISSGDTPAILREGTRYNALHIAAISNQPFLSSYILKTIIDPDFLALLYDQQDDIKRGNLLLDLYLNTPDKSCNETALHFACKFGFVNVVEVLIENPLCDRSLKNRYGETAFDIICNRCIESQKKLLKPKILELFENLQMVPLYRNVDTLQAVVGEPVNSPNKFKKLSDEYLLLNAIAGPMSPVMAKNFYKELKAEQIRNSPRHSTRPKKGKCLETIGRNLARANKVKWNQFWKFLGDFCDLKSHDGWHQVENHLKFRMWNICKGVRRADTFVSPTNSVSDLCRQLQNLSLRRSPEDKCRDGRVLASNISDKMYRWIMDDRRMLFFSDVLCVESCLLKNPEFRHDLLALRCLRNFAQSDCYQLGEILCHANTQRCPYFECLARNVLTLLNYRSLNFCFCNRKPPPIQCPSCDDDFYYTPPPSPEFGTPSEGPDIFLSGDEPSEEDDDVLEALSDIPWESESTFYLTWWRSSLTRWENKRIDDNIPRHNSARRDLDEVRTRLKFDELSSLS